VVEAEHRARRLDPVVDLRHRDEEAVAGEPHRPAQRRLCELEDVGVEEDTGVRAAGLRSRHERAHGALADADLRELSGDYHRGGELYVVSMPPSTGSSAPVMYDDASLARKIAAAASSTASPFRPAGTRTIIMSR